MPTARLFDRPQDYLFRQPVPPPPPPPPPVKPPPPFTRQDQFDAEMVGGIGSYRPQTGASLSDIAGDMTEGGQGLVKGGQSIWGIPLPTSIKASPIDLGNGYRLVAVVKPAVLNQSGQVLIPARLDWEMVASIPPLKQPAPQEINPGNSLVDPTTGKVIYTAPSKPSKLEHGKVLVDDPAHPGGYLEVLSINGNPQRNAITGRYAQIFRTIPPPASLREAPPSRNYEKWNPATKTHDTIIEKWNPTTSTWEVDKALAGKPAPAEAPPRLAPKKIPNNYVVGGEVEVYSEWDNQAKQWVYDYEGADKRAKQIADDINKQARQSTIDNAALVAQQQSQNESQRRLEEAEGNKIEKTRKANLTDLMSLIGQGYVPSTNPFAPANVNQEPLPFNLFNLPGGKIAQYRAMLEAGATQQDIEEVIGIPIGAGQLNRPYIDVPANPLARESAYRTFAGPGTKYAEQRAQGRIPVFTPESPALAAQLTPKPPPFTFRSPLGGTYQGDEAERQMKAYNALVVGGQVSPSTQAFLDATKKQQREEAVRLATIPAQRQAKRRRPFYQV